MKPPLRTEADRSALIEGLRRGVIDAVATDHAPTAGKKNRNWLGFTFWCDRVGNSFPALYSNLVLTGMLELEQLLQALTFGPGRVVNQDCDLIPGGAADLVVIDLARQKLWKGDISTARGQTRPLLAGDCRVGRY